MKVTDLSLTLFNWKSAEWRTGRMSFGGEAKLGIVTITTDEGLEDHSFLGSSSQGAYVFASQPIDVLKSVVVGRNPLDTGAIWEQMWRLNRTAPPRVIEAVDVALWDLAGKIAGLPIFRLLGACRTKVPAYASSA